MLRTSTLIVLITAQLLLPAIIAAGSISARPRKEAKAVKHLLKIAELNCENLFDTLHTEGHADEDFLPDSKHAWTDQRYRNKLDKLEMIAREIASLGHPAPIDLVALTEVENDIVLRDLTQSTMLSEINYRYLLTTGADPRGINVALLYREGSFRLLQARELNWSERVSLPHPTRHTLHAQGIVRSGDTLDIFVCHLPSKYGKHKSTRMRRKICVALKAYIDTLTAARPEANIVIIGDMNDTPDSRALTRDLGVQTQPPRPIDRLLHRADRALYNTANLQRRDNGALTSYKYRGHWELIDQCIVNGRLLDTRNRLHLARNPLSVAAYPFLLEADRRHGDSKPWRTYQGAVYRGGYSDHLPIIVTFEY